MELCGRSFDDEVIARINAEIAADPQLTRTELSRRLCDWLGWQDARGRRKEMSARVALGRLAKGGHVQLPASRRSPARTAAALAPRVDEAGSLTLSLAELGPLELVLLAEGDRAMSQVWRSLMARHHPIGAGPLCGAQLRYLIRSARHGWLGALAFSAPAWHVAARERFIGWDEASRRAHLQRIVCNSRFLILPQVRVQHLASHVLGRCLRRLAQDWSARYGVCPVLVETYVDRAHHVGTCYRASNWQWIGDTDGRGRQDRAHARALSPKAMYVYPLHPKWRAALGVTKPPDPCPRAAPDWVHEEYATLRLGDRRLTRRLMELVRDFYARPEASLPEACGSRAKTKAAYRFFDHGKVTMDVLLNPHFEATARRCRHEAVVLAAQDSTSLNYSAHPATTGLGPLNTQQDRSIGLWMHDTLAFTPAGVPLGLLDVQCWARDPEAQGKAATRHARSIEDKESAKWLTSFKAAEALAQRSPESLVVSVGDREADLYELLVAATDDAVRAKVLVRAQRTRRITREHGSLWTFMHGQPVSGIQALQVPRRGAARARVAQMSVRHAAVELQAPKRKPHLRPLRLWAVLSREDNPPPGARPLEWMLLTTVPVTDFESACERLDWYATRWQIEVYHRTLKSGCKIEERQLGSADRLETCLGIDLVVAWRVFYTTKLGRDMPDAPCTVCFEDDQWRALVAKHTRNPHPPPTPPSLREAIRMIAALGGFLGRKGDGEPGTQTIWKGLQRLDDLTDMYRVFTQQNRGPPGVQPTYG